MNTQETAEAVFHALLDPSADLIESAQSLGLPLTEFLEVAESPQVTGAIEALERLAEIRARALLARAAHTAIEALERIAASDPQTPGAVETCRKAAAQLLRMAAKQPAPQETMRDNQLTTARDNAPAPAETAETPEPHGAPAQSPAADNHHPPVRRSRPAAHASPSVPRSSPEQSRLPGPAASPAHT